MEIYFMHFNGSGKSHSRNSYNLLLIPLMVEFHVTFHFSDKAAARTLVHISLHACGFLEKWNTGSNLRHTLNFTRLCPIVLQMVTPDFTQQRAYDCISPHLHQYLSLSELHILPSLMAVTFLWF